MTHFEECDLNENGLVDKKEKKEEKSSKIIVTAQQPKIIVAKNKKKRLKEKQIAAKAMFASGSVRSKPEQPNKRENETCRHFLFENEKQTKSIKEVKPVKG